MNLIKKWPENQRPREKLLNHGPTRLSDAELLAIVLRVGVKGCSALDLASLLLSRYGSFGKILNAPVKVLCSHAGIGRSKSVLLYAIHEISIRLEREKLSPQIALNSPRECERYLKSWLKNKPYECFVAVFLDNKNQIISCEQLFHGTIDQVSVYPREVARISLEKQASAIIVAHNHPSGIAEPSQADIAMTKRLSMSLDLLDIRLLDHLIIGNNVVISLAERGIL